MKKLMFKICLMGEGGVGKTSLFRRFITGKFDPNYQITIGLDLDKVDLNPIENKELSLVIGDIGGSSIFEFQLISHFRGAYGAIFVYDITRERTLDHIKEWIESFKKYSGKPVEQLQMMIVGNKVDLKDNRQVATEKGAELAKRYSFFKFLETSAKDGTNVNKILPIIGKKLVKTYEY